MQLHEKIIYEYQTISRGLLDKESLLVKFNKALAYFDFHLSSHLPPNKNAEITEIPCGFGKFLYYLKKKGYNNFRGYDFDPQQIELAKILNLPAYQEDAFTIINNLPEQDAIIAIDFFEHLEKDEATQLLIKFFNKLKEGASLFIRVPSADGIFGMSHLGNDFTHKWALTEIAWKKSLLPAIGFKEENIIVKDERVPPSNFLARTIFKLNNFVFKLLIKSIALGPPNILSRSMWIIAKK